MISLINRICALLVLQAAAHGQEGPKILVPSSITGLPSRIAFGSCCHEDKPQPILRTVVAAQPDLFLYLGDNVYGDTRDMEVLRAKYAKLGAKAEFQALRAAVPTAAIWDDHDYGANDAGKEYPHKAASKDVFLEFWAEPKGTERWERPGIYAHHLFEEGGRRLQVILLDTRSFRDPLLRNPKKKPEAPFKNAYQPDPDEGKTLLGAAQWKWLKERLSEPADLRIVASSIQFGHEYNGWESWTNLPAEQERFLSLIRETRANGVVFVSGDVHWGEISRRDVEGIYPVHDVTSSGLTQTWPTVEENKFRVGGVERANNFGLIEIDWAEGMVSMQLRDVEGAISEELKVPLESLKGTGE